MKERMFAGGMVALLILAFLILIRSTDAIFVGVSVVFFLICLAYAEGCDRL
jgi:hypothetical protein